MDNDQLEEISPEPAYIPTSVQDVDKKIPEEALPDEHVQMLWNGAMDSTVPEADRLPIYWHHKLRHAPLFTLKKLSIRSILPKFSQGVITMPLCSACVFATAHRRN